MQVLVKCLASAWEVHDDWLMTSCSRAISHDWSITTWHVDNDCALLIIVVVKSCCHVNRALWKPKLKIETTPVLLCSLYYASVRTKTFSHIVFHSNGRHCVHFVFCIFIWSSVRSNIRCHTLFTDGKFRNSMTSRCRVKFFNLCCRTTAYRITCLDRPLFIFLNP